MREVPALQAMPGVRFADGPMSWAPKALHLLQENAVTAAVAGATAAVLAVAVAVVIAVHRRRAESHLLGSRRSVQLVPVRSFDPSLPDVLQVASLLSAVRPAVSLADRRSAPVRLRFVSRPGSALATELSVPASSLALLQQGTYAGVEHRTVPHATPAGAPVDRHLDPLSIRLWEAPDDPGTPDPAASAPTHPGEAGVICPRPDRRPPTPGHPGEGRP